MRNLMQLPIRLMSSEQDEPRVPFDVMQLEREVEAAINSVPPDEETVSAEDLERLTSEAVLKSYESGATALETLRDELRDMLTRNDEMVRDANDALKRIDETIAVCREQGKLFALRVSASADLIKEVRKTCDDLRTKLEQ